jgi:hypothetical protein
VSLLLAVLFVAAPAPPPPPLTAELLVGRWDYEYGQLSAGWIVFGADGTYSSRHGPDPDPSYCGQWEVRPGAVVLTEYGVRPPWDDSNSPRCGVEYEFRVSTRRFPAIEGTCGSNVVRLSKPRRVAP